MTADDVRATSPAAADAVAGDAFKGTARKAAKLSIARGAMESFADVKKLIKTLPTKTAMKQHKPKITTDADSGRVSEERRNVRVAAHLYAASREDDNDFHLIIGVDPDASPKYMTIEISGLPPSGRPSRAALKRARTAFKDFFRNQPQGLPGTSYDFYDPPIPIEVEGSLFFDMSHANGQGPGPEDLRDDIPTIWEIHPVTRLVFEP